MRWCPAIFDQESKISILADVDRESTVLGLGLEDSMLKKGKKGSRAVIHAFVTLLGVERHIRIPPILGNKTHLSPLRYSSLPFPVVLEPNLTSALHIFLFLIMRLSKSLYAIALLAGSAGFVLSALTVTEITDDLQSLTKMLDNVISDVNDLTIATGDADTSV